ncbi:MAG: 2-hydroxyacid dehydrogenase [Flavobacteriaceae bacterium]
MSIVIIRQDGKIESWQKALQTEAPNVKFYSYLEAHPKNEIEVAIVWKHPKGIFKEYPKVKYIASFGAGVDFLLTDKDIGEQVLITRVVDPVLANDMAEFVLAVILSKLKNLDKYNSKQVQGIWEPEQYKRIEEMTVGIMGIGALGTKLGDVLNKLGFNVIGWSGSLKKLDTLISYAGEGQRDEFLSKSEILVCLLPLTEQTRGILNRKLFEALPPQAYVINVARGGHLVDEDLIDVIDEGHLSGACLDVFHDEPLPLDHPFWKHPKIFMTPHVASVSDVDAVVPQLIENYFRYKNGLTLINQVSTKRGY